jgi:uncharacterized coiled-coil DUF342 family protein
MNKKAKTGMVGDVGGYDEFIDFPELRLLHQEHAEIENRHDIARAVVDKINKERDEAQAVVDKINKERDEAQAVVDKINKERDEAQAVVDKINKERDEMVADFIQIRMERNLKRIELTGSDGDWQRKRTLEEIERYT